MGQGWTPLLQISNGPVNSTQLLGINGWAGGWVGGWDVTPTFGVLREAEG